MATQQHWTKTTLGDIGIWNSGITTPNTDCTEYYDNGTIPFIKGGDLKNNINININNIKHYITKKALENANNKFIPKGSVLLARSGNINTTIGEVGINNINVVGNEGIRYVIVDDKKIINKYLFFYLMANRTNLSKLAPGSAIKNIAQYHINTFPISLPPLEEQQKISSILKQAHILNKELITHP